MHRMRRNVLVTVASALALTPLVIFAWTGPTASPPNGNVAAPINVGTTDQVKDANIGVNGLVVFGNSLFGGSTGSNAYLNFGATAGASGYGIRDNAGLLEFKSSGGSWKSIQSTVFDLVGGTGSWTASGNNIYNNNTGNVGIGTAGPAAYLDVSPSSSVGSTIFQAFSPAESNYATKDVAIIRQGPASGGSVTGTVFKVESRNSNQTTYALLDVANAVSGTRSSKLYVRGDGNVGIGTANPVARLEVVTSFRITRGDASGHAGYEFVQESDDIGLDLSYFDTATHLYNKIAIFGYEGSVGFGMRGTGSGYKLAVNGGVGATGFYNLSDRSLKTNIRFITGALNRVMQLQGVSFDWKDSEHPDPQIGFIAQDVEKIVPELTSTNGNTGLKSVDYARVAPLLVEALKEQQKEIESLKSDNAALKRGIEELRSAIGSGR